jgi:hypothetical protein
MYLGLIMKSKVILLLLSLLLVQSGCDTIYIVKLNNKANRDYSFDCGKSSLIIKTIEWQDYHLFQKYSVNNPIVLFPDSLKINLNSDNSRIIAKTILINKKKTESKQIVIKDSADIHVAFSIAGRMSNYDTLKIIFDSFTKCNNKDAFKDTIRIQRGRDYIVDTGDE